MTIPHTEIMLNNGDKLYGGNQSLLPNKYRKNACGMIAACDILLRKNTSVNENDYLTFLINAAENYFYKHSRNLFGISPRKIIKHLESGMENVKFRFINHIFLNKTKLIAEIMKSLSRNIPVIVRIGENGKKLPFSINYANRTSQGRMRWHYISVTGIEKDKIIFSSWGGKGEMYINDLIRFFGFTGGIIISE